jgi:hypothetical protein
MSWTIAAQSQDRAGSRAVGLFHIFHDVQAGLSPFFSLSLVSLCAITSVRPAQFALSRFLLFFKASVSRAGTAFVAAGVVSVVVVKLAAEKGARQVLVNHRATMNKNLISYEPNRTEPNRTDLTLAETLHPALCRVERPDIGQEHVWSYLSFITVIITTMGLPKCHCCGFIVRTNRIVVEEKNQSRRFGPTTPRR